MKQDDHRTHVKIGGREIDLARVARENCLSLEGLKAAADDLDPS